MSECCAVMQSVVDTDCAAHDGIHCPDRVIVKVGPGRYVMPIKDEGTSWYEVPFCPWCGSRVAPIAAPR